MIFAAIAEALSSSVVYLQTEETNTTVQESFRLSCMCIDREALANSLDSVNIRDSFTIHVSYANSDQRVALTNRELANTHVFCDKLELFAEDEDIGQINISISVVKGFKDKAATLYSLSHIEKYWRQGGIGDVAAKLSSLFERACVLESSELSSISKCGTFVFCPAGQAPTMTTNLESPDKDKIIASRDKGCHFYESKTYRFVPQDFDFECPIPHRGIQSLFDTLKLAFSVIFIADISTLTASELRATIKGYRQVVGTLILDSEDHKVSAEKYYELYKWAYGEGTVVDRLGIIRNLLSIHIEGNDYNKIKDGAMDAVLSNYTIYLKENVKQYIELKNKLSEQIQKQSEKASDMVKSIGAHLKTSIFTVYSFIITTFIIRSISKTTGEGTFTNGVYLVFLMFLVLSICTLVYAYRESESELARFESIYISFKSRFDDLLSKSDRDRILQNDSEYLRDVDYVKSCRSRALALWTYSLAAVFLFVTTIKFFGF
jgi:hypothetical protein